MRWGYGGIRGPHEELGVLFEDLREHELVGLWKPLGSLQLHTGLVLVDVRKLRSSSFVRDFVDVALSGLRANPGVFCNMAELDVINHFASLHPGQVHTISRAPEWHYIPARDWVFSDWRQPHLPVGALGVTRWLHYCPTLFEVVAWSLLEHRLFGGPRSRSYARRLLEMLGVDSSTGNAHFADRSRGRSEPSGSSGLCGKPVKLLHVPGQLKGLPFVQWLLRWWSGEWGNFSGWNASVFRTARGGVMESEALGRAEMSMAKTAFRITNHFIEGIDAGL